MDKELRIEYELAREVKEIIAFLQEMRHRDLPEYFLIRDKLKEEMGLDFYRQWFEEALEI